TGEVADDLVEARSLVSGDGLRPGGGDGDLVAEPVRAADEQEAQRGADDQAAGAEDGTDADEHGTEEGQQDEGLERIRECGAHSHITSVGATPGLGRAFPRIVRVLPGAPGAATARR